MTAADLVTWNNIKTIDSSDLRNNWKLATSYVKETCKPLIVKTRNLASYVILDIDEYEDMLSAARPGYKEDIAESRAQFKRGEFVTMDELFAKIK